MLKPVKRVSYPRGCGRFYEVHEYYEPGSRLVQQLVEYKLGEGQKLFKVYATYAKSRPCIFPYHVAAKTKKEARQIFEGKVTWLKIERVELCDEEETAAVCADPRNHMLF